MLTASVGKSSIATGCLTRLGFHSRQSEKPKKADGGNCKVSFIRTNACLRRSSQRIVLEPDRFETLLGNPRTECCCQPVARMIAAIVAPSAWPSIASTRACFEPGRLSRGERALVLGLRAAAEIRLREAMASAAEVSTLGATAAQVGVSVGVPTASCLTPTASRPATNTGCSS